MKKKDFQAVYRWLADAPLFIDMDQVDRFHDAALFPTSRLGPTTIQLGDFHLRKLATEIRTGLKAKTPIIKVLEAHFDSIDTREISDTASKTTTIVYEDIRTPQRQLLQLAGHYEDRLPRRAFYVTKPTATDWRDAATIAKTPKLLVFLDLPGQFEAKALKLPPVKFIPMAAELGNGKTIRLYSQVKGIKGEKPPKYDEIPVGETHRQNRRRYWAWFDKHFSATRAMQLIETAAGKTGRIQWIDFRVPVSRDGDTLHVHIAPQGTYDTGAIAYRLVRRGFRHGVRLVGTMNSGPDMHVLAAYDK